MTASNDLTIFQNGGIFVDTRFGSPRYYLTPPKDYKMRIPETFRKTVAFVGLTKEDKNIGKYPFTEGTAFMVQYESERHRGVWFHYLVTAAHVAEFIDGNPTSWLRLNTHNGLSDFVTIGENMKWYFHPTDPDADIAVLPLMPDDKTFDYRTIARDDFLTDEHFGEMGFGAGDDVFIIGLFAQVQGNARMLPIVRMGTIAMIPPVNERIAVKWKPKHGIGTPARMEAYLIEARSISGISGAPVFTARPELRNPDKPESPPRFFYRAHFLGLVHGHWDLPPDTVNPASAQLETEDSADANKPINMGIAIVTPAKKLLETIMNHPELKQQRAVSDDESDKRNAPVADSTESGDKERKAFTRNDFMRDLNKVVRKKRDNTKKGRKNGE